MREPFRDNYSMSARRHNDKQRNIKNSNVEFNSSLLTVIYMENHGSFSCVFNRQVKVCTSFFFPNCI